MHGVNESPIQETPPVAGFPPSVRTEADRTRLWDECQGLVQLGLADEARRLIKALPADGPEWADFHTLRLQLDADGPDADWAAFLGRARIGAEGASAELVDATATALLTIGRAEEAWALLQQFPYAGTSRSQGLAGAAHASAAGDFAAALRLMLRVVTQGGIDLRGALLSVDLAPLWKHCAEASLTEESILVLAHPAMQRLRFCAEAPAPRVVLDARTVRHASAAFRSWLQHEPITKSWDLSPLAPDSVRRAYEAWQQGLRAKHDAWIATGIARAQKWVLERQKEWAVEKAIRGNFLGARWHLAWAVGAQPLLLRDFEFALGGFPEMTPVLQDFRSIQRVDPALLQTMARHMIDGSPAADALDSWESRIPHAVGNGLFLCHQALFFREAGDDLRHAEALLGLTRRWPADPLGWVNLTDLCCACGQWESARTCAQKAPRAAWFFHIFANLVRQLESKDRSAGTPFTAQPFFGQKDLGDILRASSFGYPVGEE